MLSSETSKLVFQLSEVFDYFEAIVFIGKVQQAGFYVFRLVCSLIGTQSESLVVVTCFLGFLIQLFRMHLLLKAGLFDCLWL